VCLNVSKWPFFQCDGSTRIVDIILMMIYIIDNSKRSYDFPAFFSYVKKSVS
jgi:hypothetical protein